MTSSRSTVVDPALIEGYLRLRVTRSEADLACWERAHQVIESSDAEAAFAVVRALVAAAKREDLGYVAAGALEVFVPRHGSQCIDALAAAAAADPKFRDALAQVWLVADDYPPTVLARLQAATGNRIKVATQAELDALNPEAALGDSPADA